MSIEHIADIFGIEPSSVYDFMESAYGNSISSDFIEALSARVETAAGWIADPRKMQQTKLVPYDHGPRIYFLFRQLTVVYIGQTTALASRIQNHTKDKDFDAIAYFDCPEEYLTIIEEFNISYHKPPMNGVWRAPLTLLALIIEALPPKSISNQGAGFIRSGAKP